MVYNEDCKNPGSGEMFGRCAVNSEKIETIFKFFTSEPDFFVAAVEAGGLNTLSPPGSGNLTLEPRSPVRIT